MFSLATVPTHAPRSSPYRMDRAREIGLLVKRWRSEKGLNRTEAVTELKKRGVDISYGYLNMLESGARSLTSASLEIREGIRYILGISKRDWEEATGLYVPGEPLKSTNPHAYVEVARSIPVYRLSNALGDGRPTEMTTDIPVDWEGDFKAYIVEGEALAGLFETSCIVKVQLGAEPLQNDLVICHAKQHGVMLRRFVVRTGNTFYLATGSAVDAYEDVEILGVVLRSEIVHAQPRQTTT